MNRLLIVILDYFLGIFTLILLLICLIPVFSQLFNYSTVFSETVSTLLPLDLIICLFLMAYWSLRRSKFVFIPLFSVLISFNYILSTIQITHFGNNNASPDKSRISICTYNVHGFKHGVPNNTIKLINDFARENNVGILCIQEYDTLTGFNEDSIKKCFPKLKNSVVIFGKKPGFGLALFSEYPILKTYSFKFKNSSNHAMWSDLKINNDTIRIFNFHMQTTNFNQLKNKINLIDFLLYSRSEALETKQVVDKLGSNSDFRIRQGKVLSDQINRTRYKIIACGDMNANPASYTYHQIKGKLLDGFKTAGHGYEYTYKGLYNLFRIDYIFHSRNIKSISYKSFDLEYSDHKPVIMKFQ